MKKGIMILGILILSIGIFFLQFRYEKTYQPHTYYRVYLDEEMVGIIKSKNELNEYISKQGELIKNQVQIYKEQLETLEIVDSIINSKLKNYPEKTNFLELQKKYKSLSLLINEDGTFEVTKKASVEKAINSFPEEYKTSITIGNEAINNYELFINKLEKYFLEEINNIINYLNTNKESLNLKETEQYHFNKYIENNYSEISYIKQIYMSNYSETNNIYLYAEDIYTPLGINIQKTNTYHADLSDVKDVYGYIIDKKPCTIEGYQFRIKKSTGQKLSIYSSVGGVLLDDYSKIKLATSEDVIIYVTDPKIFEEAVTTMETIFVGNADFEKYKNNKQEEIVDTGTTILDIYVEEDITIKKTNISVKEVVYNEVNELSSFLLYGENKEVKTVKASSADTITSLSYKNKISVEEFFLSNPEFTSINNIFYTGQEVVIAKIDPQISVVVEKFTVEDQTVKYDTVEQYDSKLTQGTSYISQKGVNGTLRVSQNVRSINGTITYVKPTGDETIKQSKNEIILIGTKVIPHVGSVSSWGWPTKKGYTISSYYGYRTSPITGRRELHSGIDIAGTGMGSPVYASNNGTIIVRERVHSYGYYIMIDHNNGYYTLYAHMNGFAKNLSVGSVVSRGQLIGYVGSTGYSTGPHLHFEIRVGCSRYSCVTNPWPFLNK